MTIEFVGIATIAIGILVLWRGPTFGLWTLIMSTLFGAAAAFQLPRLGGSSIPPAIVLMGCFALTVGAQHRMREAAISSVLLSRLSLCVVLFVCYAVITAWFLPRIFEGSTYVYSLARYEEGSAIVSQPLAPQASNVTQSAYLIADLVCFACVAGYVVEKGTQAVCDAVLAAGALLIALALIDLGSFYAGFSESALAVFRNANYRVFDGGTIAGFKRVVGPFAEAGAYGYAALGLYAFALSLWLDGVRSALAGSIAAALAVSLLLSTSTAAYAALAVFSLAVAGGVVLRLGTGKATRRDIHYLGLCAVGLLVLFAIALFAPKIWSSVLALFDATVSNKLLSQSGVERTRWNHFALRTFWDTATFGAGVGSVRASSIVVAVLASLGVVGLLLFVAMLVTVVLPRGVVIRSAGRTTVDTAAARAASRACLALAVAACVSAASVDLGLTFFIFAGVLAATLLTARDRPPVASSLGAIPFAQWNRVPA